MTREYFYKKYGNVKVKFQYYYKYTFTYKAVLEDGSILSCGYGGNHDDIYRHDVSIDREEIIKNLKPYMGGVYKDGKEVCSFYDY